MFHRLLIAAALAVGAPAIGAAVAPDLGIGQAQAQVKFTGKIKRIRIKKRRVGTGYKLKVVSQSDPSDPVVGGTVTFRDPNSGEVLGEAALGTPQRGRAKASGDESLDALLEGSDVATLVFQGGVVGADGAIEEPDEVRVPIELTRSATGRLAGEGVGELGWKARVRTARDGTPRVVIMHENRRWAGAGIADIRLASAAGEYGLLYEIVENDLIEDEVVEDVVNQVVETSLEVLTDVDATLEFSRGGTATGGAIVRDTAALAAPDVDKLVVRETGGGDAKLVTITQGEAASLATTLIDDATGEAIIETVDDTPISTVRHYLSTAAEFDPGEDPAGYVYLMLIDMLDDNGDPTGEQYEVEAVIPALVEGEVTLTSAPFGEGLGVVSVARDAESIIFGVGLKDQPGVESVNLIFEEPFEGPAPLETEINVGYYSQHSKWVQKGAQPVPGEFTAHTTMFDDEGQVVGGVTGSGTSTGRVAGNGSGTRKASTLATRAQQIQVKLL